MTRKAKSQWDFGELFPPQETRQVLTVSELTGRVRQTLERGIGSVWVGGGKRACACACACGGGGRLGIG